MKTKTTITTMTPLGDLTRKVCRMGGSLRIIPILLSVFAVFSLGGSAFAQKSLAPVKEATPPTVIVIQGEYPGDDHIPAEVMQYALAKDGDSTPPSITQCPSDATAECFEDVGHVLPELQYEFFCGPSAFVFIYEPAGILETGSCPGTEYEVTYVVWDQCGNNTSCVQTFTLENDGPQITFCPEGGEITSSEEAIPNLDALQYEVSCPNDPLCAEITKEVVESSAFDICLGELFIYTYIITDGCGREDQCQQIFNILPPPLELECSGDEIVECFDDIETSEADVTIIGAIDDVATFITISEPVLVVEGGHGCGGAVYEVTYTVTDDCDREASCVRTFTIENEGPEITAPADVVIECAEDAAADIEGAIASAACDLEFEITAEGPILLEGDGFCDGSVWEFVYTVTDECGREATDSQLVTISNEGPSITAPADVIIECAADAAADIEGALASAACSLDFEVTAEGPNLLEGDGFCDGSVWEFVYTVTDECGREATDTQMVTISNEGPSITAPEAVIIECAADAAADLEGVVASAACDLGFEVTFEGPNLLEGDGFCDGSVWEFVYTVTDECGREATDTQMVTISNEGPSITAPEAVIIECAADAAADLEGVVASAACDLGFEVSAEGPNLLEGDGFCDGSVWEFVYTVTDECGREATDTQMVTISNEGPSITAPEAVIIECAADAAADIEGAVASASCDFGFEVTAEGPFLLEGDGFCDGSVWEFVYTVTDDCGREATDTQMVTISNEGPSITAPEAVIIECAADAAADLEGVVASAACDLGFEVTAEGPFLLEGDGFCDGSVWEFVYTVTDDCGREATDTQMVTISNEGPTIGGLEDTVVECVDEIGHNFDALTIGVACGLDFDVTATDPELLEGVGSCNGAVYTVTYTVVDECGREASTTQHFTIENDGLQLDEAAAPQDAFVSCYEDITPDPMGVYNAVSTACSTDVFIQITPPTKSCCSANCPGTEYVMTYTIIDACGEVIVYTQLFTIENEAPSIEAPADQTVSCFEDIVVDMEGFEASAACDLEFSVEVGELTPVGEAGDCPGDQYTVTYTATDECGRSTEAVTTFTIENEGPSITAPEDVIIECAADAAANLAGVATSTFCGIGSEVSVEGPVLLEGDGFCDGSVWEFIYTVTDECGGTASDSQLVTISNEGPSITAPEDVTIECAADAAADIEGAMASASCDLEYEVTAEGPILVEGDGFCDGSIWKFIYTVTDECDRTATDEQFVTISNAGPSIAAPEAVIIECASNAVADIEGVFASASCDLGFEVTAEGPILLEGDGFCDGSVWEFIYTVTDDCGREASDTQMVTISNEGPSITAPEAVIIECAADAAADIEGAVASAACDLGFEVTAEGPFLLEGDGLCDGSVWEFVYTVTDDCGREATDTQMVTISNEGPSITAPAAVTLACATDAAADIEGAVASAACGLGFEVTAEGPFLLEGDGFCNGSVWEFVYTVTDDCGREASDAQMVTISNDGPMVFAPADITIDCSESTDPEVTGTATAEYACEEGEITFSDSELMGSCPQILVRTWTATDPCGETATATQTITIEDTTAPTLIMPEEFSADITCQDVDLAVAAQYAAGELTPQQANAFINTVRPLFGQNGLVPVGTQDDCSDSDWDEIDVNVILTGLECPQQAIFQCFFVAIDECGNTSEPEITQLVVNSVFEPTITAPEDVIIECASEASANIEGAIAEADCNLGVEVTAEGPMLVEGDGFCDGSVWKFIYTATDDCDRTATAEQFVTISNEGPQILECEFVTEVDSAEDAVVNAEDVVFTTSCGLGADVSIEGPVITDNECEGLVYEYVITVTDECGRTDVCERMFLAPPAQPCADIVPCYGAEVLNYEQGPQTNGNPVAADRSDPNVVLGAPSLNNSAGNFFSLGVGGFIEIGFAGVVLDLPGNDILVVETSFSGDNCGLSDDEFADIELSADGINWVFYGTICRNEEIDIAVTGLEFVTAIRITNSEITTTLDGYDVDGVVAINGCQDFPDVTPEPGDCYATEVLSYSPVGSIPANRMDPTQALGAPERDDSINFVALGFGGELILGFGGAAPALEGVDDLEVVETTFGNQTCDSYEERADVYVSQQVVSDPSEIDDSLFEYVGESCTNGEFFDVHAATGWSYFTLVKIVDVTPEEAQLPNRDGYDVDGIVLIHNCLEDEENGSNGGDLLAVASQESNTLTTFPNPTEGQSNVIFTVGNTVRATLHIYDASGREIATLFNQVAEKGMEYRLNFDGNGLPNGMYIYRLTTEDEVIVRKFMITK